MATGSTYDFEVSRDEIIRDALANVGAIGPDDSPTGAQTNHAARALNRIVKSVDADGAFLWRVVRRTTTTTDGTATFTPAADVIGIDQPMRYVPATGSASTIMPLSRDEYMGLADRTTEGTPRNFLWEKTLAGPTVTLWPVPEATGDTIEYAASVRSRDFDDGSNTPDFPPEWGNFLVWSLSAELAPAYGQVELGGYYINLANGERGRLVQSDTETGDVYFVPRF